MFFLKFHYRIQHILLVFILFVCNANGQDLILKEIKTNESNLFDHKKLKELISEDSLFVATKLLNETVLKAKKLKLKSTEAAAYNAIGEVSSLMISFKFAEHYHLKAYRIYDSIRCDKGKEKVLSSLLKTFLLEKNYKKFDSLYPYAQNLSKTLKSELFYLNLENKIKKHYYAYENKELLNTATFGLRLIDTIDFSALKYFKNRNPNLLKKHLSKSFLYYTSIANIKLKENRSDRFDLLFKVSDRDIKTAFKNDPDLNRKLGTYNYYKYLYFSETVKNSDSATKYLLKADSYKYDAIVTNEKRNARNGNIMYNIINTQNELRHANEIRKKDLAASKNLMIILILTVLILATTLLILSFYIKAKRNIKSINIALKKSNDKLLATDKERLEFFSIVSHELRTPIYGISGLATLVDQEEMPKKRQHYLNSLISSSNYLSILIDNILQFKQLRFEEKKLRLKADKIPKVVKNVISTVETAAKNKGLELRTDIDATISKDFLMIDKVAFSQVLINLAYNAIRYTKQSSITISVKEKKRSNEKLCLAFAVEDTGIGIKESDRAVVFNAFENKTFLHKNSSGSGLGLFVVKTLLKCHNAEIDFISTPGIGTKFFFEIEFKRALIPEKLGMKAIEPQQKSHVLIVDDNQINLLVTQKNIEKIEGFTCEVINNGKEAISMIKDKDFDLILMDINMPDMDGYETTKHIRKFNKDVPILALTALNSAEIALKAMHSGINQIITKPYLFEDFKHVVLKHVRKNSYYLQVPKVEAI